MQNKRTPKVISLTFGVLVLCFLIGFYIYAWTGPTASPPSGNVEPPVRSTGDTMSGPLTVSAGGGDALIISDGGDLIIKNVGNTGLAKLYCDADGKLTIPSELIASGGITLGGEYKTSWPEGMSTSSDYGRSGVSDTLYEGTTALSSKYLGISAKAADADKLDNHDSSYFMTATTDNWVDTSGDTMSGPLAMGGNKITGLAAPTADNDAATKAYVDAAGGGFTGCVFRMESCNSTDQCSSYCNSDEYLVGGGCQFFSFSDPPDFLIRKIGPYNSSDSTLGERWFCRTYTSIDAINTTAICCK